MCVFNEYNFKNVLIAGGSGLIGKSLSDKLIFLGYKIKYLSSKKYNTEKIDTYFWDIEKNILPTEALLNIDIIIYLSGSSIYKNRWTQKQKNIILSTRIKGMQLILKKIKDYDILPKVFICANGAFYNKNDNNSFLFNLSKLIDINMNKFKQLGIRSICFHNGIVLSKNCFFLKKISKFIKFYLGAIFGNGKQYVPWIHINDLCRMYIHVIKNFNCHGCYYAIAPNQINNAYFIHTFAKILHRPLLPFKVPSILFKIIYGEMADLLLKGDYINVNNNIPDFIFNYATLGKALKNIYK